MRFSKINIHILSLGFCLIVLFLFAGNAQAMMVEQSLEELAEGSDAIVIGTVEAASIYWNAHQTNIYTKVTVSVQKVIKGEGGH